MLINNHVTLLLTVVQNTWCQSLFPYYTYSSMYVHTVLVRNGSGICTREKGTNALFVLRVGME